MLPPRLLRTTWSRQNRNRFVFPPILSRLTQEEALADTALLVILADESVLGHIMAVPTTPIRLTGNGPLPHTSSARNWFIGVMARAHSGTRAADINPEISARPPLPFAPTQGGSGGHHHPFSPTQGGSGGQAVVAVGQAGNLGRGFAATLPLGTEESSMT